MRKLLQILNWITHPKLTRLITSALSVGTCVCAKIGRFDLIKGGDKMIGKQYFKVEIYVKRQEIQQTLDFFIELNRFRRVQNLFDVVVLQNIAANKKVPSIQVQVDGAEIVNKIVNWLSARKSYGYVVWLSKEDDFTAVRKCNLLNVSGIVDSINMRLEEDENDYKSNRVDEATRAKSTQSGSRKARSRRDQGQETSSQDSNS